MIKIDVTITKRKYYSNNSNTKFMLKIYNF